MTGENDFLYLDREDYERLHGALADVATAQGEPIPPFAVAKQGEIDALVNIPRRTFFGHTAYPTFEEKAAIIFYTINKKQIFLNGNKRMSTLSLLVFIGLNNYELDVPPDELTQKALWLAKSESVEFPAIKEDLVAWIRAHIHKAD